MFTPCNACPVGQNDRTGACPARPVAPEDGTGVGSGNPTGVESFLFLSRSMRHAPCLLLHWGSMLYALCAMPSALALCLPRGILSPLAFARPVKFTLVTAQRISLG